MSFTEAAKNEFLEKLTKITEANLANEIFGVSELAREMGMSHSNLHRNVKKVYGTSISQFIRQVKLRKALELLKHSSLTISEVAFECGFHSVSYFTKCFHDYYGFPPGKVRDKNAEVHIPGDARKFLITRKISRRGVARLAGIASALIVIFASILLLTFKPFSGKDTEPYISIAVLPFLNDSPGETDMYFLNGTMHEILENLRKIEDLRVPDRYSVENYRNSLVPLAEIAKELDVQYILVGNGQKYGTAIQLSLQLYDAVNNKLIWKEQYNRTIELSKDFFALQSEISQIVAAEIRVAITPEEKIYIDKSPTKDLTAYLFYHRALEQHMIYLQCDLYDQDYQVLQKARDLYQKAIDHDSVYAKAYSGLALVYIHLYQRVTIFTNRTFLDSALLLADKSLSIDNQEADAFFIRGYCYWWNDRLEAAHEEFDKAIALDQKHYWAYQGKGYMYLYDSDYINSIDYLLRGFNYERGPNPPILLRNIGFAFAFAGFDEQSNYYMKKALELDGDSNQYYFSTTVAHIFNGNFEKALEIGLKGYFRDSLNANILIALGGCYLFNNQIDESFKYIEKYIDRKRSLGQYIPSNLSDLVGYYLWQSGHKEEAENIFDVMKIQMEDVSNGLSFINTKEEAYYTLAAIHAQTGDEAKAFKYLQILNQIPRLSVQIPSRLKYDPFFNNIRDEPEFQQIVKDVEVKYQRQHERVRQWLEENEML